MDTKISMNSRVYTDIQGLRQLHYDASKNPADAKKEVAHQFEAILMQMVFGSMRSANKAFASDMFSTDAMDFYQDMFDKQLSLMMSNTGVGFADMVEKNLDQKANASLIPVTNEDSYVNTFPQNTAGSTDINPVALMPSVKQEKEKFNSKEDFVKTLWSSAKTAASALGASPEILIAQAALETNWGQKVLPGNSHNLFNVKAGSEWNKKSTTVDTLEEANGVLYKEKSRFRSYESYKESFMDYVNVLKQNDRYNESVNNAAHPEKFVNSLQNAGYATDHNYANKIMKIFSSPIFQNIIAKVKSLA